jgi:hypothetical protein
MKYSLIEAIAMGGYDAKKGHGYDTTAQRMRPRAMQDGWPYDPYELDDPEEWESDSFEDNNSLDKFTSKTNNAHMTVDPNGRYDQSAFVDGSTRGLSDNLIRKYIRLCLEDASIRLRPRSSEPDGAVTQWGTRIPGGSQFGWSSAYPFKSKESEEPVYSLKDLMTKREDKLDRYDGEVSDIEDREAIYNEDFE